MTIEVFPVPRGSYPIGAVGTVGGWRFSSLFGGRPNPFSGVPSWHGGEDIVVPRMTPLIMPSSGRLAQSWDSSGGGWWSTIYPDAGGRIGLGHADHYAGLSGQHVQAGTTIAWTDSTGASTGDHMHYAKALTAGGPWVDPYDDLVECAAAGRFVGEAPPPIKPLPDPETVPQPEPPHPRKALITMQYWTIKGEPTFYKVDTAPLLRDDAVDRDGNAGSIDHMVGGVFAIAFAGPPTFTLDAGIGVSPIELDPGDPQHAPLVDELRKLPLVTQAR